MYVVVFSFTSVSGTLELCKSDCVWFIVSVPYLSTIKQIEPDLVYQIRALNRCNVFTFCFLSTCNLYINNLIKASVIEEYCTVFRQRLFSKF